MTKGQILPQYEFGLWIDRIITDYSPKNRNMERSWVYEVYNRQYH